MIDPDYFGCSGKLTYQETSRYGQLGRNSADTLSDFSLIGECPTFALSIDRVNRCASDWTVFAQIALNHVLADIEVGQGEPEQVMIAYEFGPDAYEESERSKAVAAFIDVVKTRGLALGKCHSAVGLGPTAVTIAVAGRVPSGSFTSISTGTVLLDRRIGYFKLHYMAEMGLVEGLDDYTRLLTRASQRHLNSGRWAALSDISGHGLLGTVLSLATRHSLDLRIVASPALAASPLVLSVSIDCLENQRSSYGEERATVDERAWSLLTLRETAGPIVGLWEGETPPEKAFGTDNSYVIGTYAPGTGRVSVSWSE